MEKNTQKQQSRFVKLISFTLAGAAVIALALALTGCSKDESGNESADVENFTVGVKADVPKFGYLDPATNKYEGYEVDIAKEVANRIAKADGKTEGKVDFKSVTAKTRGPLLDNGELDFITATYTITEERKLSMNFSDPYYTDAVRIMIKKDSGIKDFKGLDGKTIGVAQTATSIKALEEEAARLGITVKFNEYATYPEIRAALDSGRVDAFSVDGAILAGYLDNTTELLPEKLTPQEYGVATKLSNKELAEKIDKALTEMEADGTLADLKTKWELNK